jgi:hypothetical protein
MYVLSNKLSVSCTYLDEILCYTQVSENLSAEMKFCKIDPWRAGAPTVKTVA